MNKILIMKIHKTYTLTTPITINTIPEAIYEYEVGIDNILWKIAPHFNIKHVTYDNVFNIKNQELKHKKYFDES